ncbi:hypothetical protein [Sinorhizobium sp. NFACC03]|uniref:hypothetical protein n=1 Tax=Sinorhizobium sp. NFACC03 TaxID=1566295 RepID=UPI000882C192|nr:hypothetical protein [Sinorhizobium sp. NFACC03]SDA93751.1 hypothetical protein SAMN03159448_05053 [Sinorhizobium sp. NFACC03]
MAGSKTHEQQRRTIEKREETSKAGDDFDAEEELKRSKPGREVRRGRGKRGDEGVDLTHKDDRQIIRGTNQESEHHKRRADGR